MPRLVPTGRGIGPAYEDKVARRAIRFGDLFNEKRLAAKFLDEVLKYHNFVLKNYHGAEEIAGGTFAGRATDYGEASCAYACRTLARCLLHIVSKAKILCLKVRRAHYSMLTMALTVCDLIQYRAGAACVGSGFG